jgi:hypothetical protein
MGFSRVIGIFVLNEESLVSLLIALSEHSQVEHVENLNSFKLRFPIDQPLG